MSFLLGDGRGLLAAWAVVRENIGFDIGIEALFQSNALVFISFAGARLLGRRHGNGESGGGILSVSDLFAFIALQTLFALKLEGLCGVFTGDTFVLSNDFDQMLEELERVLIETRSPKKHANPFVSMVAIS